MSYKQSDNNIDKIAIVGMACKFPGASNVNMFWDLLSNGKHIVTSVPKDRFDINKYYDENINTPNKTYVNKGAFINSISSFDADFFSKVPREAIAMDPHQRILLECTWHAFENAGYAPSTLNSAAVGVFVGATNDEYKNLLETSSKVDEYEPFIPTGSYTGAIAGRISYEFGFSGPSMVIDTHYSASLVSMHVACQSLRNDECDVAIAAGVHLILSPEGYILFSQNHTLSPDGYSRTFDVNANGFERGEGCGVLILKKLSRALEDGDRVHAVILGSAVNQDGHSITMSSPNELAQEELLHMALERSSVLPSEVSYLETHGTGTPTGDPIEVQAIGAVLSENRKANNPLYISSVKTNIGHLEAAAGIAGVIKTILSLKHRQIAPHLHLNKLNPEINLDNIPAVIPTQLQSWDVESNRRVAGVSSFGITGTNAHILLEEFCNDNYKENIINYDSMHVLCISAKNNSSLQELIKLYIEYLENSELSLQDICYTSNVGREHFDNRIALVAKTKEEMCAILKKWKPTRVTDDLTFNDKKDNRQSKVAFLFLDVDIEYNGAGKELYEKNTSFRKSVDECSEVVKKCLHKSLYDILWSDEAVNVDDNKYNNVINFVIKYALYNLWESLGVKPTILIGQNVGEYVLAVVSGVMSLNDALTILSKRELIISNTKNSNTTDDLVNDMLNKVCLNKPRFPIFSAATGREILDSEALSLSYWMNNFKENNSLDNIENILIETKSNVLVDISYQPMLEGLGKKNIDFKYYPSLRQGYKDLDTILGSLANLYTIGINVSWNQIYSSDYANIVDLPLYPFSHKEYWPKPNNNSSKFASVDSKKVQSKEFGDLIEQITNASDSKKKLHLTKYLQEEIKKLLHLPDNASVSIDEGLMSLGVSSLLVEEFRCNIISNLVISDKKKIPKTFIFNYPNISTLADYILSDVLCVVDEKTDKKIYSTATSNDVAIVGMSCRFPGGANSVDEYWDILSAGVDTITEVPLSRFDIDKYYDPDAFADGKIYCRYGGFLNTDISEFDAKFFNISSVEAQMMDPQQRLALEISWEALESACINPTTLSGTKSGVFFGVSSSDYQDIVRASNIVSVYTNTGLNHAVLPGRISHFLGINGPSMAIDTACSSGLVAVHEACKSLNTMECNLAIAGGINLIISPNATIGFCKGGFLSEDGACKTFDESANGYVRGEGGGVVILKRLSDAIDDNDTILGVIKGTAVNQDGKSATLTAPNGIAQTEVIKMALKDARINAEQVSYVEAHGSGTALGDPIEVNSLIEAYRSSSISSDPLVVSSVKPNIGHLEAAAGVAGIMKVVLAMQNDIIPRHLHFNKLNPSITADPNKFFVPVNETVWVQNDSNRFAGVSSFAFQGTNAHVIVSDNFSERAQDKNEIDMPWHILTISANTLNGLANLIDGYKEKIYSGKYDNTDISDICFSSNIGRKQFHYRTAIVTSSVMDLSQKLDNIRLEQEEQDDIFNLTSSENSETNVALVCIDQPELALDLTARLYEQYPLFKKIYDECNIVNDVHKINYTLYKLCNAWGINPDYIVGGNNIEEMINIFPESLYINSDVVHKDIAIDFNLKTDDIWHELLCNLSLLYVNKVDIDWVGFHKGYVRNKVSLPTYPFQRKSYWVGHTHRRSENE